MKRTLVFLVIFLTLIMAVISCNEKTSPAQPAPEAQNTATFTSTVPVGSTSTSTATPSPTSTPANFWIMDGGYSHTLAIKTDGSLWAAGSNTDGELGICNNDNQNTFVKVTTVSNVIAIAAGRNFSLALKGDGTLWACGRNTSGQLGTGDNENRNCFVQVFTAVKAIAAGGYHSLAVKTDGTLWASGNNSRYQLGRSDMLNKDVFSPSNGSGSTQLTDVKKVEAGEYHSIVLKNDNTVYAAGANDYGQLGYGNSMAEVWYFSLVPSITNINKISCGAYHTMLLTGPGVLMAAGSNVDGQFGVGNTYTAYTFFTVNTDVNDVKAGDTFNLIMKNDYTVHASGDGRSGQYGDTNYTWGYSWEQVNTGAYDIGAGYDWSFVRKGDLMYTAGANLNGQIGVGNNNSSIPSWTLLSVE